MATSQTILDEGKANQWMQNIEQLNAEVDKVLVEVANLLQKINTYSAGPFVDKLVSLGQAFHNQFEKLKNACAQFVTHVKDTIDKMRQAAEQLKDNVVSTIGKVINAVIT